MDVTERARSFDRDMLHLYDRWRLHIHYTAPRFRQLVETRGGVDAAKYLLSRPGQSSGFQKLAAERQFDLTVEYLVLQPEFASLFTLSERRTAWLRLRDAGMRADLLPAEPR